MVPTAGFSEHQNRVWFSILGSHIWQESGTTFSTLSRTVFAPVMKTGNVWRSMLNAVTKVWTGSDCKTAERLLGLGAGGLPLAGSSRAHCSEPGHSTSARLAAEG